MNEEKKWSNSPEAPEKPSWGEVDKDLGWGDAEGVAKALPRRGLIPLEATLDPLRFAGGVDRFHGSK